jgi:hypothetical protein
VRRKWEEEGGLVVRIYGGERSGGGGEGGRGVGNYEGGERPYLKNKS